MPMVSSACYLQFVCSTLFVRGHGTPCPYNLRFTFSVGADIIRPLFTIRGLPVFRDDVGIVPYKLRFTISVYLRDVEDAVPYICGLQFLHICGTSAGSPRWQFCRPLHLRFTFSVGADIICPLFCIFVLCPFQDIVLAGRCGHRPLQITVYHFCRGGYHPPVIYNLYVQHYLYADTARRVPTICGLKFL